MGNQVICKKEIIFSKIDYFNKGRRDCSASITVELRKAFNNYAQKQYIECCVTGKIFHTATKFCYEQGQCIDSIEEYVKDEKVKRIIEVWKRWHNNGFHLGCEHQRDLEKNRQEHFGKICPICGYKFGSDLIHEELPDEIIKEIKSW